MTLQNILDAQVEQLALDDLLAAIAQEERGDGCEVEKLCHESRGVNLEDRKYPYQCGYLAAGTVNGCPRRRRLLAK